MTGGLIGAVTVLLFHPVTQPFVQNGLRKFGESPFAKSSPVVPGNLKSLPLPEDLPTTAKWLDEGCRRILAGKTINRDDLLTFDELAHNTSEKDPDNAFWKQTEAIFQERLHNYDAATAAWTQASKLTRWNDYQTDRLRTVVGGLTEESGRTLAWHWAVAYTLKDYAVPTLVARYGFEHLTPESTLEDRLVLLDNGKLVRDGARSRQGGQFGWQMIESAAIGSATPLGSRRDLLDKRMQILPTLSKAGLNKESVHVLNVLSANEAWDAALQASDSGNQFRTRALQSVIVASVPGALVFAGIASALLYVVSLFFGRYASGSKSTALPCILGIGGGLAAYFITGLVFPAVFLTIVLAGFLIRPSVPPLEGTKFRLDVWVRSCAEFLGLLFVVALAACAVLAAPPVQTLASFDADILDPKIFLPSAMTLAIMALGLSLGAAQVWAFTRRRDPYVACSLVLRSIATTGLVVGFTLGVAATPFCIAADKHLAEDLSQLVQNEPSYYLQNL